jgi:CheY-like chemotaxis protein
MIGPGSLYTVSESIFLADEPENDRPVRPWSLNDMNDSQHARPRVLIVDDQKLIADTLAEILAEADFDATACYNGKQALEIAARFHPQWLISDVLMPQMNGVALAIAIRQSYPQTSILLFSGQAGISEILLQAHREGYEFELIAKPIHPTTLINRLKQER